MCLGVPGKVIELDEREGLVFGRVDFGGARREVCLAHVPEARCGDWVLVHVGFALSILDEEEARRIHELLREIGA